MARELGKFIASGRMADVHEWGPGWVLKLFREGIDLAVVRREHSISIAVFEAGAPAPRTGAVVAIGPRYGIEYERVDGVPLPQAMRSDPSKLFYYADLMADTQLQLNSIENVEGVPLQSPTLELRLSAGTILDSETKRRVLARLCELATGSSLCHGDFHPENIIVQGNRATVLDWTAASRGDASGDLAGTLVILNGYLQAIGSQSPESHAIHQFTQRYLSRYLGAGRVPGEAYRDWIPIVAATRLSDGIDEQREWLMTQVRSAFVAQPQ
ncbi:MAG: aminoglycoside phosphotransferase family protein [Terracidiphilus sp.]|jgi:tRNA A-37 threonylcarbamoyl transferase component Bud32